MFIYIISIFFYMTITTSYIIKVDLELVNYFYGEEDK